MRKLDFLHSDKTGLNMLKINDIGPGNLLKTNKRDTR